jgi:crossover junction endodeoxyribonuclease RusA
VRSKEANQYKASVKALTLNQEGLNGDVAVSVVLLPKLTIKGEASKVIMDLDNSLKVLLDALQGIAYTDDAQVKRITAEYGDPVKNGGVMITIEGYEV